MKLLHTNGLLPALAIVALLASCKVPYDPPVKGLKNHYLVVEGFIRSDGVPTDIKLSRTRSITWGDTAAYINETGALVVIEDNQNNSYPLYESGGGNYTGSYNLNTSGEYRLHITTADHKEYLSDFVPCKPSPPIDSIGWYFKGNDVQLYANTHDPSNQSIYYRWDYTETWEFHSRYYSILQFNHDTTVSTRVSPVDVCYRSHAANNIYLGSSEKLSEDIISEAPLALIPNHDNRLSVLYSILVTQYALDSSAYNYWNAMKNNTQNVGSIFGTQPNQTTGNIHCLSDSTEPVIGYVGAGTTMQKRIFISHDAMPQGWNQPENCDYIQVPPVKDSLEFYFGIEGFVPITPNLNGIVTLGYYSSEGPCVDCTLSGTTQKPAFWP